VAGLFSHSSGILNGVVLSRLVLSCSDFNSLTTFTNCLHDIRSGQKSGSGGVFVRKSLLQAYLVRDSPGVHSLCAGATEEFDLPVSVM
jgi:hypothetical protein